MAIPSEYIDQLRAYAAEHGYEIDIRSLARHLGVSTGTIYNRYGNKDEILRTMAHLAADEGFQVMWPIFLEHAGDAETLIHEYTREGLSLLIRWGHFGVAITRGFYPEEIKALIGPVERFSFPFLNIMTLAVETGRSSHLTADRLADLWIELTSSAYLRGFLTEKTRDSLTEEICTTLRKVLEEDEVLDYVAFETAKIQFLERAAAADSRTAQLIQLERKS